MLTHLHIRNYALISHLDIDFHEGFSVMTGETGAGKSIIIDSINLLLGAKADSLTCRTEGISILVPKGSASKVTVETEIPESVCAPVTEGDVVGKLTFKLDGDQVGEANIISSASANRITFAELLFILIQRFILW